MVTASWFYLERNGKLEKRFVISTRVLKGTTITWWGRRRWAIEGFFKTAKYQFGLARLAVNKLYTAYAALRGELERRGHLSIANSLWAQQGVIVKQDFIESSQKFYAAAVANLNFTDSNAIKPKMAKKSNNNRF